MAIVAGRISMDIGENPDQDGGVVQTGRQAASVRRETQALPMRELGCPGKRVELRAVFGAINPDHVVTPASLDRQGLSVGRKGDFSCPNLGLAQLTQVGARRGIPQEERPPKIFIGA